MKKLSRILAVILSLIMIISAIPITASAGTVTGTCGENLTWTFDDSTGTLTISGTGAMDDYDYNNRPWESYEYDIIKVVINNGVTSIGDDAFNYCTSLTSITIPDSVTTIGVRAFDYCTSLENVTIGDSVTAIGDGAFSNCTSLTSITIPDSVTTIGYGAFSHSAYENDTNNWENDVLYIGDHLIRARSDLSGEYKIKEGTLTIAAGAFWYCTSLTSVAIGDGVTSISENAFRDCRNLTSITIPDSVTIIGDQAFYGCQSLASITIPDSVTSIGRSAFSHSVYENDTNNWENNILYIGDHLIRANSDLSGEYKIKEGTLTIAGDAFAYCYRLISVTIPDSVRTVGDCAFIDCIDLTNVTVDINNKYYLNDEYGVLFNKDKTTLIQYPIGNTRTIYTIPDSVTTIGDYAFSSCDSLTSVTISDSVTTIGNYAFSSCDSLESVTIPDSVTTIGNSAFKYCDSLTSITIPDSVTTIGNSAFKYCDSLTSITIPDSVTTIGEDAFEFCESLTSITVNSDNEYYSSNEDGVLFNKDKTTLIQYPIGNTRKKYTIPDSVTSINEGAFMACKHLTDVTISDVTAISDYTFYGCINLISITIPDSVTSISGKVFYDCTSLTSVTIPDSVTTIDDYAFYDCHNLTDVYYSGTEEEWKKISISSGNQPLLNATIHFHTHECDEWTVVTEPTCTKTGLKTGICECGDVVTEEIPATGHKYESVVTPPTCTERGYTTYTCHCGYSYVSDYVDATGHKYNSVVTPPTCTEKGFTTYTCHCGYSYVSDYVDATGHKYNSVVTQPTCEQNGYTTCTCECGDSYIANIIPATGHADNDGDGYCDACPEVLDPTLQCGCNCHKSGISKFFFDFILFFQRIFGSNKECACGVVHY